MTAPVAHRTRSAANAARRFAAAVAMLLASTIGGASAADADKPASGAAPATKSQDDKAKPGTLPTLAEILVEAERTDTLEQEARKRFGDPRQLRAAETNIAAIESAIANASKAVDPNTSERLQVIALIDLAIEIRSYLDRVGTIANALDARARAYDADLDRINAVRRHWTNRIEAARGRNAPADLLTRIEAVPQRLQALAQEITLRRDAILTALDRATRLRGHMATMLNEASERRDRLIQSLTTARVEPLWRAQPQVGAGEVATAWLTTELRQLRGYFARHGSTLAAIAAIGMVLGCGLIVVVRRVLAAEVQPGEDSRLALKLFRWPIVAAAALTLVAAVFHAPEAPLVFYTATLTLLFLVSAILARGAVGHEATLTLYVLSAALLLNWAQGAFDALPFSGRFVLIVQSAAVAAALWIDMRRGRMSHPAQLLPPAAMRLVAWIAIVALAGAIVAAVVGSIGLARQLRDGALRTLGFALVLNVLMRILHGVLLALLQSWVAPWSRIAQYQTAAIRAAMRFVLHTFAVLTWLFASLFSFKALGFIDWLQDSVDDAKIEIGTVTISADAVLLCIGVLLATWVIVKVTRLVLELELLSRLSLSSATSFVISASVRYLLTVAGLILAMAALGIDFSKVTLLVSAIGVGIGFGLQNVVNNFVSGLLLLGERVINVGDTVQVGSLTGVVRRIGVRSSTVRTYLGAEVIVPNSDLTSKEVINFTLSDRHRRLDITVGVDYGSDPDKVVALLIDAAVSQPRVLQTPAPVAAFVGFGESSLDFRLQAWIANYEEGLAVETALRKAILTRLRDAGIGIPFPQRDVNLRAMTAPPPMQAGAGT